MAKNGKNGGGRIGAIKNRTQFQNPETGLFQKRNKENGQIMEVKTTGDKFKGVTIENSL